LTVGQDHRTETVRLGEIKVNEPIDGDSSARDLAALIRSRRSVRDFLPDAIPPAVLDAVLGDAHWSPSWSNTQPYRVAIASGALKDRLKVALCQSFDASIKAQRGGMLGKLKLLVTRQGLPDGDYSTHFDYPREMLPRRRATGFGLYELLGIARTDADARQRQLRKNFEFFGAPTVMFVFVHEGLHEFGVLDAGIFLQTLMLSAQARGLATCAQGALATWAGSVRQEFEVPRRYKLICGISVGYASTHPVNRYNPGRGDRGDLLIPVRTSADVATGPDARSN
jgi:nitroreductase